MPAKSKAKKDAAAQPKGSMSKSYPSSGGPVVLYWHRTDLRLHDSPALQAALALNPSAFYPVWTWDPHYVYTARCGANRWRFLLDCMRDLSHGYAKLCKGQRLWVVREGPERVLKKLCQVWGVTHLVFEKDTDAYARGRDEVVMRLAREAGVVVVVRMGRTLFDPDELVERNGGGPTMSMSQVVKAAEKINGGKPDRPLEAPGSVPGPGCDVVESLQGLEREHEVEQAGERDWNANIRTEHENRSYNRLRGPKGGCEVPTLEEMGIDPKMAMGPHRGGETEALRALKTIIDDEEYIGLFEKPKSAPTDFQPRSTSVLSAHHHFGSLSVRKFWWDVQDVFERRKAKGKTNAPAPMNMPGQLLFRDMYFGAQAKLGFEYAQARGNSVCRFIPWKLQSRHAENGLLDGTYNVDDEEAEEWFTRWKEGRTGFPWIDALMRQLKTEGWIHHLGRHAVACFLTRGGCYVHWERGAEVFEEWLIDHEVACNVGNWMWLSCTAFFSQFYRCYSPVAFAKKWDPEGDFVRHYVPELAKYDKKYIYEPHKAPIADQRRWGCLIKGDGAQKEEDKLKVYPKPMLDFNKQRQVCMDGMKHAYDVHLYGDSKEVLDGSWKKKFSFSDKVLKVKDEANGDVAELSHGTKRGRSNGDFEPQSDDGADADHADEEPPTKASKSSRKGDQQKIDRMVSRGKTKT